MRKPNCLHRSNDILTKIITTFATVLFFCIVIVKGAYLFDIIPIVVAIVGCGILTIIIFSYFRINKIRQIIYNLFSFADDLSYKRKILLLLLTSLITKLLAISIFQINSLIHPDINVYVTTSNEIAEYGVAKSYANYCYSFSHMYWFSVFLLPVTKIFGVSQIAYSVYLTLILTASTLLLFDTVFDNCKKSSVFISFIIFTIFPSQILLPQFVTHEIALLFFLSIAIWLYFKVYKRCDKRIYKCLVFALTLVSLFFGSAVNAMGLVAIIAFALIFLIEYVRNKSLRYFIVSVTKVICLLLVFIIGTFMFNLIQVNHSVINYEKIKTDKFQWTLYVGSNYESKGQWYDDKKWDDYPDTYGESEVNHYHQYFIKERYNELFSNPRKAIVLLKEKLVTIWGNFTYSICYTNETIINKTIQSFYYKFLFKPFCLIEYIGLTFFSILGLFFIIKQYRKKQGLLCVFCELYLLGATSLLMLTECNNKYIISILPIFILFVALMIDMNRSENHSITVNKTIGIM